MPRGLPLLLCLALAGAVSARELHDIRGPVAIMTLPPFLLSGVFLLLFGGLLFWRRKLRIRLPATVATPATTAPTAPALEQLEQLEADYRRGAYSGSELISRLDGLLRDSIAHETALPALHLTAPELLTAAASVKKLDVASLAPLLALLDRLKFTGQPPAQEEVEQALSGTAACLDALRASKSP